MTQRDVAKRLSRSPSAVNLWESGKTEPGAHELVELARWYKVSLNWLLGLEDFLPPQASAEPAINTVPIVSAAALARWDLAPINALAQTMRAYPAGTAAAFEVDSDALASLCARGALAVVSSAHPPVAGAPVLAAVGDALPILRRYEVDGGTALLVADDARYPTHTLTHDARIIGRVVETVSRRVFV